MMTFHLKLKEGMATIGQAGQAVRAIQQGKKLSAKNLAATLVKAYTQCQAHRKRIAELTDRVRWLEKQLGFQGGG